MILERIVKSAYNRILRPLLPRKIASFNGVPVRQPRLFDTTDVRPDYEDALVSAINQNITSGDRIVVIGGGWGVSSVYAARQAGSEGKVTVFEGGSKQIDHIKETIEISCISNRVDVQHAVVGPGDEVYGQADQAVSIAPDEVPMCGVLILDCEGSEIAILQEMSIRPRTIIVETHHMYDAPASKVRALLADIGYEVVTEDLETTPYGKLPVLTAMYQGSGAEENNSEY